MAQKLRKSESQRSNSQNSFTAFHHLLLIVIVMSATVFPFIFDSFTASKLLIASVGLLTISIRFLMQKQTPNVNYLPRWLTFIIFLFAISMMLSWVKSGVPFMRGAYGQFGRGNGFFYYTFAILVFIFSAKTYSYSSRMKSHQLITYFSWFLAIYAFLQKIGIDIAKLDTLGLSPVVLTFGNSNFAGGMLAILFTYHFVYHLAIRSAQTRHIALLIVLVFASTFPAAVQGYLIITFAIIFGISIFLLQNSKSNWVPRAVLLTWVFGLTSIILGVMGKFLLAPIFARNSFQIRIEYWKITTSIIKDNFFFGVGPDKLYDTTSAYMSPGSLKIVTATRLDNAHNWYLNLAANFGILPFLFLAAIFSFVLIVGIKLHSKNTSSDPFGLAMFSAFIAIFIDGLVSLEQPGIGIWLYFFAGVTLGNWLHLKNQKSSQDHNPRLKSDLHGNYFQKVFVILTIAALSISTFTLTSRVINDAKLRTSIQTQMLGKGTTSTLESIGAGAISLRSEPEYTVQALRVLASAGAGPLLNKISEATYEYYPSSLQATLIRADVLRAIERFEDSCSFREPILKNTPWSKDALKSYVVCLALKKIDVRDLELLRKSFRFLPVNETEIIPVNDQELTSLKNRFGDYALSSRINLILGSIGKANMEKDYALNLLSRIQELENAGGLAVQQPERSDNLILLNF
jgi:hypothetical protein